MKRISLTYTLILLAMTATLLSCHSERPDLLDSYRRHTVNLCKLDSLITEVSRIDSMVVAVVGQEAIVTEAKYQLSQIQDMLFDNYEPPTVQDLQLFKDNDIEYSYFIESTLFMLPNTYYTCMAYLDCFIHPDEYDTPERIHNTLESIVWGLREHVLTQRYMLAQLRPDEIAAVDYDFSRYPEIPLGKDKDFYRDLLSEHRTDPKCSLYFPLPGRVQLPSQMISTKNYMMQALMAISPGGEFVEFE